MNWEAIGAISDTIGAFSILATLIYLSVQVRESRKVSVAEGSSKGHELHSNWRRAVFQNPTAASVLAKANIGEVLSDGERVQLQFLCDELFYASVVSNEFSRHSGTLYSDDAYAEYLTDIIRRNPSLVPQWQRFRENINLVSGAYGDRIDAAIGKFEEDRLKADG